MPAVDVVIESEIPLSIRARQVCGMFDCPPDEKQRLEWKADMPIEEKPWSIGLITGPSGCGKTTIARDLWPDELDSALDFSGDTLIDCFDAGVEETAKALSAVGLNTVPAWLRPYHVLSNGEKFRAEIAKRVLEQDGIIVVDEFTSVVDRQVAKVASHAVQKYIRREGKQLVAVACHDDIIDWLQPDWVFRPDERAFNWRSVRRRPEVSVEVARVPYSAWRLFAPFHYMSADLHRAARCYGLWCNGELASFMGVLHRPHPRVKNLKAVSRVVTLPDYQGLGLSFALMERVASAYAAMGFRFRNYPAHPAFVRAHRKEQWRMVKRAGKFSRKLGNTSTLRARAKVVKQENEHGSPIGKMSKLRHGSGRPCAVLEYVGEPMSDRVEAAKLIGGEK